MRRPSYESGLRRVRSRYPSAAGSANPRRQLAYRGCQPSSRLALALAGAAQLGRRTDRGRAGDEAGEPGWDAEGLLGPDGLAENRDPLAHRRGLVVDHVEGAGGTALDRRDRRGRRVLDLDEGEGAAALADDRQAALLRVLGLGAGAVEEGAGTVEPAVAKDDSLEALGAPVTWRSRSAMAAAAGPKKPGASRLSGASSSFTQSPCGA